MHDSGDGRLVTMDDLRSGGSIYFDLIQEGTVVRVTTAQQIFEFSTNDFMAYAEWLLKWKA